MLPADEDVKRQNLALPALFFFVSFGLTLAVLASVNGIRPDPPVLSSEEPPASAPTGSDFPVAAEAFRRGDFAAAEADLTRQVGDDAIDARVLLGLYAHTTERYALALELLRAVGDNGGELEDWRLWALADSARALGQTTLAQAVLERLIADHPSSPLRSASIDLLATQAVDRGDWLGVVMLVEGMDAEGLDRETRSRLAQLLWQAGKNLGDLDVQRSAARRLLIDHPTIASELSVADIFRHEDGSVPWSSFLSTTDLIRRSESLLEAGLPDSALMTLAEIPESARTFDWYLEQARSLTASKRGEQALSVLEPLEGTTAEARDRLAWARARAALEMSTPRRQRRHITAEQRREIRSRAHLDLRRVAEGEDELLAARALRTLFSDLFEQERFDETREILEQLKRLDPDDTTGARPLWARGWKEYTEGNHSGAIGYWTELAEIYPRSNFNRSGLYWSARSHQKLGNEERAQELLRKVVDVEFTDLYRRHALERLVSKPEASIEIEVTEPWPTAPELRRAERLHALGLDDAALLELEAQAPAVPRRATEALKARVLAAKGERRNSIISLRRAFPVLGTPYQSMAPADARRMYYPLDFKDVIEEHSRAYRLPSHLVFALIRQESAFDTSARSRAGAQGLMQIMPATGKELARRLGLRYSTARLSDPAFSVQLGTSYLNQVLEMFDGNELLALAGYNAGPYRIKRLWRQAGSNPEIDHFLEQLSFGETRNYVKRVLLYSDSYRRLYGSTG